MGWPQESRDNAFGIFEGFILNLIIVDARGKLKGDRKHAAEREGEACRQ